MIENDIDIKINGLTQEESEKVINSIIALLRQFTFLDLRRFNRMTICEDVNKEILMITNKSDKNTSNLDPKQSHVYAKVITVVENKNINIHLILNRNFSLSLVKNIHCSMSYRDSLHVFHHELSHIHDFNKKIDIFQDKILNSKYEGIHNITYPLAQDSWSEYIANFMASTSTHKRSFPKLMAEQLAVLVNDVPKSIKTNIMVYQANKNRIDVFDEIKLQIEHIIKTASYLLGYMHGLNVSLAEISDKADYEISKSAFRDTWESMSYELISIQSIYPHGWEKLSIYEKLASCFKNYYKEFGIILKQDETKKVYFELL